MSFNTDVTFQKDEQGDSTLPLFKDEKAKGRAAIYFL